MSNHHSNQTCPNCHYELTGIPLSKHCYKCPECGHITDKNETLDAPWYVTSKNRPGIIIGILPSVINIVFLYSDLGNRLQLGKYWFVWMILLTVVWFFFSPLIHTVLALKWSSSRFDRGPGFTYIRTLFVSLITAFITMLASVLVTLAILPFS